jgi:hypothetical protein
VRIERYFVVYLLNSQPIHYILLEFGASGDQGFAGFVIGEFLEILDEA